MFLSPEVSVTLPFKRYAKKKFMIMTDSDAYQKYIRMKKDQGKDLKQQGFRILSISSFYKIETKECETQKVSPSQPMYLWCLCQFQPPEVLPHC